jgi:hypothetical protein
LAQTLRLQLPQIYSDGAGLLAYFVGAVPARTIGLGCRWGMQRSGLAAHPMARGD